VVPSNGRSEEWKGFCERERASCFQVIKGQGFHRSFSSPMRHASIKTHAAHQDIALSKHETILRRILQLLHGALLGNHVSGRSSQVTIYLFGTLLISQFCLQLLQQQSQLFNVSRRLCQRIFG